MKNPDRYDAVFISDIHFGNRFADTGRLRVFLDLLRDRVEALYLVGDIFDAWRNCSPQDFTGLFAGFKRLVFIRGNHDGRFAGPDNPFPGAAIDSEVLTWRGRPGLVTHAHFFDEEFENTPWWGRIADSLTYFLSGLLGKDLKKMIGAAGSKYSEKIEDETAKMAGLFKYDFVVMGHTHYGGDRTVRGIRLFNLGSWLTEPYALFKCGDRLAMKKIAADDFFPGPDDFF